MRGLQVWVVVLLLLLMNLLAACNSEEGGGWGFRNLGKRNASNVGGTQAARSKP